MEQVKQLLGNQRGNMTVFVLTIFFFLSLVMFTLLFNMSTIFVDKEVAANSAQQASIAAVQIIYEEAEEAIREYDSSIAGMLDPDFIMVKVDLETMRLRSIHPDWSESEVRYRAIDNVLLSHVPANGVLYGYLYQGLESAQRKIREAAGEILQANGATRSGSVVTMFDSDMRIEVETSVRYQSDTFGLAFLNTVTEKVKQTAKSRRIAFAEVMGWGGKRITL
ncbi:MULTISPECIES: Tad domain-containing protein [Bacillales]|jgi:hypothetical protein|uniref:Tad domain-containing protein n=2 Tax=Brevibacillus TaxID=55080 RepID=A0AA48RJ40_9BACL|nr:MULTISPECIES: Tad domain-containing protein [Bacillales]MBR8658922.1 Tad domain-containing protein [Brevibacillus sp. NL20B1]REK66935.1 MAG: hypothetical protein DF221_03465 [Brevibacillus sp.]MDT3416326.1 hypothetical protein [Brevibacillus aydinogluensis]NNV04452.1 hypothetical protein [Brevibacillus sp. MCWH]UFJ62650.1 Tad domain-containing protein [Anoxybacillus sediminis]